MPQRRHFKAHILQHHLGVLLAVNYRVADLKLALFCDRSKLFLAFEFNPAAVVEMRRMTAFGYFYNIARIVRAQDKGGIFIANYFNQSNHRAILFRLSVVFYLLST